MVMGSSTAAASRARKAVHQRKTLSVLAGWGLVQDSFRAGEWATVFVGRVPPKIFLLMMKKPLQNSCVKHEIQNPQNPWDLPSSCVKHETENLQNPWNLQNSCMKHEIQNLHLRRMRPLRCSRHRCQTQVVRLVRRENPDTSGRLL